MTPVDPRDTPTLADQAVHEAPDIENISEGLDASPAFEQQVVKARRRLLRAYERVKKNGGWRAVAETVPVPNMSYVYEFVIDGKVPTNFGIREALLNFGLRSRVRPMDDRMRKLWHVLSEHHAGRANAIKKRDLRFEIFGDGPEIASDSNNNLYDRELRAMLESLNRDHKGLVCSDSAVGYWWAENLREGLKAVARSSSRPQRIMDNLAHLKRNIIHTFGGQESMFDQ